MGLKSSSLFYLAFFLAISSSIHAFNITKLLGQNPDFATFNKYLTESKLVDQINRRNTITVLAVSDAGLSAISGKSPEVIKAIISTHVILDFFDEKKLMEAQGSGRQLTTLYQASGLAVNQQGFIKVKLIGEGEIAFGSAVSGAPIDVELVKTVISQPYNISILQVTKPIVAPGIDPQSPVEGAKAPVASAKAPVPTKGAKADAPTTGAQTPSSEEVSAPSPSEVVTDSPAEAPAADASSPSLAPGPDGGEDAADAETPSSSSRTVVGLVGAVMCFASLLVVM
ncbi:fasciclin arabinogalactan protein [Trifolium repens]|nr:fasciclin arabinogalactan protein [Trifolium repens]